MRAVTLEHDRHAMSIASMSGSEGFGSQVQGTAFLASQSNTLNELKKIEMPNLYGNRRGCDLLDLTLVLRSFI